MDTELLANLEDTMFNENSGAKDWNPIVKEWVENNRDYVDSLTN